MKSSCHQQATAPLTQAVHVLLLLGWLLSSHGLAPAVSLVAAWMDGRHAVKVGASSEGAVTVVLSHELPVNSAEAHEHEALDLLIAVFAPASTMDKADHVLSFKEVEDAARMLRRLSLDQEALSVVAPLAWTWLEMPSLAAPAQVVRHTQAPAWSPGLELKAGMTIMLC